MDPVTANNSASADTTVFVPLGQADLSIQKSDSPDPVDAAATLTYTITVANAGPNSANSVCVLDALPGGVTNTVASGSGWACSIGVTCTGTVQAGVIACSRASLGVGSAPPITVTVTAPPSGGTISNTAAVAAQETDPNPSDNVATETTTV